ncbi:MAG: right-handed parallel beta-helix repeat-containing protein [bacterium]|nr:right-handed parallel beta-helix repeat-containing protein [bacterium]
MLKPMARSPWAAAAALILLLTRAAWPVPPAQSIPVDSLSVADYASIQAALDAKPGKVLDVPAGDYVISQHVKIRKDGSGLTGPGRIIQNSVNEPIVEIQGADFVRLEGLTLTRPEGKMDAKASALLIEDCDQLELRDLRVIDNRSQQAAILLGRCTGAQILDCLVLNYTTVGIDDRTPSPDYGYAFNCIDGHGIRVTRSRGTLLRGNRIIEKNLFPTPELQRRHHLGEWVKRAPKRGELMSEATWKKGFVSNWHQGAAIQVTSSDQTDLTRLLGNYVENAAQGFDIHSDHVIIADNIFKNARSGMKAMHGARNVLIANNQFIGSDLWAILLQPGTASHAARPAENGKPALEANIDGGTIIVNNIISDFGHGNEWWVWKGEGPRFGSDCCPIRLLLGQRKYNVPLHDIIIQGNIVYDSGRDQVLVDGVPAVDPPRYGYALWVTPESNGGPRNLIVKDNILHPGLLGVANLVLPRVDAMPVGPAPAAAGAPGP